MAHYRDAVGDHDGRKPFMHLSFDPNVISRGQLQSFVFPHLDAHIPILDKRSA
jgi:hypothetical protein